MHQHFSLHWQRSLAVLLVVFLFNLVSVASAQDTYPSKPIRLVLPQPPGGAVDIVARQLAQRLAESMGQQVVVDNRPGANGIIAAELVAKAPADGYTLLLAVDTNLVVNPNLYRQLPYDPYRDFSPISVLAKVGLVLVAHPSVPANSVTELIALAKANPGKLNYASLGSGTQQHLGMELFKSIAGINITHIPYKGTAPAMADLLGGAVSIMFTGMPSALAQAKSGKLKLLAVTSPERSGLAPQLPTMVEAGVPGFELSAWFGLLAPANSPVRVIERLTQEVAKAVANREFRTNLQNQGLDPLGSTPEAMLALMKSDTEKWARVIRDSGAKVE